MLEMKKKWKNNEENREKGAGEEWDRDRRSQYTADSYRRLCLSLSLPVAAVPRGVDQTIGVLYRKKKMVVLALGQSWLLSGTILGKYHQEGERNRGQLSLEDTGTKEK